MFTAHFQFQMRGSATNDAVNISDKVSWWWPLDLLFDCSGETTSIKDVNIYIPLLFSTRSAQMKIRGVF